MNKFHVQIRDGLVCWSVHCLLRLLALLAWLLVFFCLLACFALLPLFWFCFARFALLTLLADLLALHYCIAIACLLAGCVFVCVSQFAWNCTLWNSVVSPFEDNTKYYIHKDKHKHLNTYINIKHCTVHTYMHTYEHGCIHTYIETKIQRYIDT